MPATTGQRTDELIRSRLGESAAIKEAMRQDRDLVAEIEAISTTIIEAFQLGHKVLLCGNGGSAADAQHIAAELVGRFYADREPLPAISLATGTPTVTAIGNDYSFEEVFARRVRGLGQQGDVLIGLSTSGNSENVLRALRAASEKGLTTIAFTGSGDSGISQVADLCLRIPSENTARIQEAHITAAHIVCELVEKALFGLYD